MSAPARSSTGRRRGALAAGLLVAVAIVIVAFGAGWRVGGRRTVRVRRAPAGDGSAYVLETPCLSGPCQSLWIAADASHAARVESLHPDSESCDEIAWAPDGGRVGFLVNGYQLRVFDARTGQNLGAIAIVDPDGFPPSRVARGVTFSANGAAITFDDCPRDHSGCKPGMLAIRSR